MISVRESRNIGLELILGRCRGVHQVDESTGAISGREAIPSQQVKGVKPSRATVAVSDSASLENEVYVKAQPKKEERKKVKQI